MRSTMLAGIVLRSTAADTPDADDSLTQRNPSTSTSVRFAPRLRSEIVVEPEPNAAGRRAGSRSCPPN